MCALKYQIPTREPNESIAAARPNPARDGLPVTLAATRAAPAARKFHATENALATIASETRRVCAWSAISTSSRLDTRAGADHASRRTNDKSSRREWGASKRGVDDGP